MRGIISGVPIISKVYNMLGCILGSPRLERLPAPQQQASLLESAVHPPTSRKPVPKVEALGPSGPSKSKYHYGLLDL